MFIFKDVCFKIASTRDELEQSYRLVCRRYREKGYISSDWKSDLWLTHFCALPSTYVFVAKHGQEVVGTISVFQDSRIGLPMDIIWQEKLDLVRKDGRKICEIGMLACDGALGSDPLASRGMFLLSLFFFKMVFDLAASELQGAVWYITVNPAHVHFYCMIGFEVVSSSPVYYKRLDAPAIVLSAEYKIVREAVKRRKLFRDIFLGENIDWDFSNRYIWTLDDLEYFLVEKTDVWSNLSNSTREYITRLLSSSS